MAEILNAIQEWPVILQGAIGSGVFWLFLFVLQKIFKKLSDLFSNFSRSTRINDLLNEQLKIAIHQAKYKDKMVLVPMLLYRMSRPLLRALMWLVLGLASAQFSLTLSIVGYIGSMYYLMKAGDVVGPFGFGNDTDARLSEVQEELDKLEDVDA